jgi:hypothetical protein
MIVMLGIGFDPDSPDLNLDMASDDDRTKK